jgi:hypothetical protein
VSFDYDGRPVPFRPGSTLAAALWAAGQRSWRLSHRRMQPRSYYCGDGFCYECLLVVNGETNVRACQTLAEPGLQVATQVGFGPA